MMLHAIALAWLGPAPAVQLAGPGDLDTFISLMFSPLMAMASLTTFVVGLSAFASMVASAGRPDVVDRMAADVSYGVALAFPLSIWPAGILLVSTLRAYT
jgi:hypothetical protein